LPGGCAAHTRQVSAGSPKRLQPTRAAPHSSQRVAPPPHCWNRAARARVRAACRPVRAPRRGARLDEELVTPVVQVLKRLRHVHVVHKHAAVRAAVKGDAQRLEALLPRGVPDLAAGSASGAAGKEGGRHAARSRACGAARACIVTSRSSTCTSFVRKSAPMVALYWLENFLLTYLRAGERRQHARARARCVSERSRARQRRAAAASEPRRSHAAANAAAVAWGLQPRQPRQSARRRPRRPVTANAAPPGFPPRTVVSWAHRRGQPQHARGRALVHQRRLAHPATAGDGAAARTRVSDRRCEREKRVAKQP
jgi:hypothetical protein